jgi:hypothetical protein
MAEGHIGYRLSPIGNCDGGKKHQAPDAKRKAPTSKPQTSMNQQIPSLEKTHGAKNTHSAGGGFIGTWMLELGAFIAACRFHWCLDVGAWSF